MSIKWDKEKIVLSFVGSLAAIAIGYFIWKHENSVSQGEAQANAQAQANQAAEQDQELEQEIAALPQYTSGGGASEDVNDTGSDSATDTTPTDSNIEAILAAFGFGSNNTTPGTPSTPVSGGTEPPNTPIALPVSPILTGGKGTGGTLSNGGSSSVNPVAGPSGIIPASGPTLVATPILTRSNNEVSVRDMTETV